MRKIIIVLGTLGSIFISSCTKETSNSIENEQKDVQTAKRASSLSGGEVTVATWYPAFEMCLTPAVECLPNIDIRPRNYSQVFTTLNSKIAISKVAVQNFFNTQEAQVLSQVFSQAVFTGLQNGQFTVIRDLNFNDNIDHYLIGEYNNLTPQNPLIVYPIIHD